MVSSICCYVSSRFFIACLWFLPWTRHVFPMAIRWFPMVCQWFTFNVLMLSLWSSHGYPSLPYDFYMILSNFVWCLDVYRICFLRWFPHEFAMVSSCPSGGSQWGASGFSMVSSWVSYVLLFSSLWFAYVSKGFPMDSLWFGMASLCCSDGHQVVLDGWPVGSASVRQGVLMVPF